MKEIIKLLIEKKIDVKAITKNSNALHLLCKHYQRLDLKEIAQLLIDKGIEPLNIHRKWGRNSLQSLCGKLQGNGDLLYKYVMDMFIVSKALHRIDNSDRFDNLHEFITFFIENGFKFECKELFRMLCREFRGNDFKDFIKFFIERIAFDATSNSRENASLLLLDLCRYGNKNTLTVESFQILIDKMDENYLTQGFWTKILERIFGIPHFITTDEDRISGDVMLQIVTLIIDHCGMDFNRWGGKYTLHLLCGDHRFQNCCFDLIRLLVSRGIDVRLTNKEEKDALDLLCENFKSMTINKLSNQQQMLFPLIKLLVDEVNNGIMIETESYGRRPNPLYLLLENYKGRDMLDIVEYFVIDKKITFNKEKANDVLRRRRDNVSNKNKIERVLYYGVR